MLRRRLAVPLVAILGAGVVVLPQVAGSETVPPIEAFNSGGGVYGETHAWKPAQATVSAGGVVMISNPTAVPHGVRWVGGPETPSCSAGIPLSTSAVTKGANWSGTCTFAQAGVYTFYCTVHGPEMTGTITVNANGTTTTSTTIGSTETSPSEPPTGTSTGPEGSPANANGSGPGGSLIAGSAFSALRLRATQHGPSVHGAVAVSQAGAGGRLVVELLAKTASLTSVRRPAQVVVGRLVRGSLHPGTATFTVTLDAKAARALRVHGRLALTVKIVLTPAHGSAVTLNRSVTLHA